MAEIWDIGETGNAVICKGIYQITAVLQVSIDEGEPTLRP